MQTEVLDLLVNVLVGLLGVGGGLLVYALGQRASVRDERAQTRLKVAEELLRALRVYEDAVYDTSRRPPPASGVPSKEQWQGFTGAFRARRIRLDDPRTDSKVLQMTRSGVKWREAASRRSSDAAELRAEHEADLVELLGPLERVVEMAGQPPARARRWRQRPVPADASALAAQLTQALDREQRLAEMDLEYVQAQRVTRR